MGFFRKQGAVRAFQVVEETTICPAALVAQDQSLGQCGMYAFGQSTTTPLLTAQ